MACQQNNIVYFEWEIIRNAIFQIIYGSLYRLSIDISRKSCKSGDFLSVYWSTKLGANFKNIIAATVDSTSRFSELLKFAAQAAEFLS